MTEAKLRELCREVRQEDFSAASNPDQVRALALKSLLVHLRRELGLGAGDGVTAVPGLLRSKPYEYALHILLNPRTDFEFYPVVEAELLNGLVKAHQSFFQRAQVPKVEPKPAPPPATKDKKKN